VARISLSDSSQGFTPKRVMPDMEDDQGRTFSADQLAALPPSLRQVVNRGSKTVGHMMLLVGLFLVVFGGFVLAQPAPMSFHGRPVGWIVIGIGLIAGAIANYLGLGPRPAPDRRVLLKRALCPVCLKPLDKHSAHGETIACACGAVWERRYL